jgi:hypothetical protein
MKRDEEAEILFFMIAIYDSDIGTVIDMDL